MRVSGIEMAILKLSLSKSSQNTGHCYDRVGDPSQKNDVSGHRARLLNPYSHCFFHKMMKKIG